MIIETALLFRFSGLPLKCKKHRIAAMLLHIFITLLYRKRNLCTRHKSTKKLCTFYMISPKTWIQMARIRKKTRTLWVRALDII
ncbi:hypothetical protein CGS46_04495 [Faecalibacterium langellae]|uniref:Uncharacterized protein n=1 Tax=Faecalibacterium langellae TaxID=3435293 RepID=A0A2A6ZCZ0_9FIRM|nr:hypothetical protein CGS46_04495 [Faecalibacterium prausnitzii]RJV97015.1 hypothetical protein DW937_05850 [Faecalibacterium sp. AM43-5AT]